MPYTLKIHTCAAAVARRERTVGDYYRSSSPPQQYKAPPSDVPWELAPPGATHALWSDAADNWYYWKVDKQQTTHYWHKELEEWIQHVRQAQSLHQLQTAIKRPIQRKHTMNLNNAALLVRDDITTVKVDFGDNSRKYTYVLHNSIQAEEGDIVVVPVGTGGGKKVATISHVDDSPQIDPHSDMEYKWVVANLRPHTTAIAKHIETTETIAQKLKEQQATSIREQILRSFGIESMATLLETKEK